MDERKSRNGASPVPAVGIDLGTTLSGVAVYRNGHTEMIVNEAGERLTPSMVFFHPETSEVLVGDVADDLGVARKDNFVYDNKRIIGRKYNDAYVQKIIESKKYGFKICEGENDNLEIELRHNGTIVRKVPEDVSSEVLKYLKDCASKYLGGEVTEAVITVPAYFSNAQRKATKRAAELAGLTVLKLITEPVAAAIHYAQDKLTTASILLVFDFGGGTLDVSIIENDNKIFLVKSVEGDTFLGGNDIDDLIFEQFISDIIKKEGKAPINELGVRRIRKCSTKMKQRLSVRKEFELKLDYVFGSSTPDITLKMTRDQLDHLTRKLFDRAQNLIEKCLLGAGLNKNDITDVLLVGGSTKIPKVQEMLKTYFDKSNIRTDLNPDEAVTLGASLQAAVIKGQNKDLEKYQIREVTPLDLGIAQDMDLMSVLLKKNSPIPAVSEPFLFTTTGNDSTSAVIEIYEGVRKNCKFNNALGKFELNNLPPARAGDVVCNVRFTIDEDGILEVDAKEISGGSSSKLVVTMGQFRLCDNKIREAEEDAEACKESDNLYEKFVHYVWGVREICLRVIYDLSKIQSQFDRAMVSSESENFLQSLYNFRYEDLERVRARYRLYRKAVEATISKFFEIEMSDEYFVFDGSPH